MPTYKYKLTSGNSLPCVANNPKDGNAPPVSRRGASVTVAVNTIFELRIRFDVRFRLTSDAASERELTPS